ncbi:CHAT domain-containing protein [Saccharopolyspora taberi]
MRSLCDSIPGGNPYRGEIASRMGLLVARSLARHDVGPDDVDEAISDLTAAVELAEGTVPTSVRCSLGLAYATRFLGFEGGQEDREVAIAMLAEVIELPDTPTDMADTCRLAAAQLLLCGKSPAGLRNGRVRLDQVSSEDLRIRATPEEIATAKQYLADVSTFADADLNGQLSTLRLLVSAAAGELDLGVPDIAAELDVFDSMIGRTPELDSNERNGMRAVVHAIRAHATGRPTDLGEGLGDAIAALPGGHVLREFLVGVLFPGDRRLAESGDRRRLAESTSTAIPGLERALERLPLDDPDRPNVLTKLVGALLGNLSSHHEPGSVARIRALASEAIEPGRADAENAGLNHAVLGITAMLPSDSAASLDRIDAAIEHLREADRLLPEGHELKDNLRPMLGGILIARYVHSGEEENVDAALHYVGQGRDDPLNRLTDVQVRIARQAHQPDVKSFRQAIRDLESLIGQFPERHFLREQAISTLSTVRGIEDFLAGGTGTAKPSASPEPARDVPETALDYPHETATTGMSWIWQGITTKDKAAIDRGIGMVGTIASRTDLSVREQLDAISTLGMGLRVRYELTRDRRDLDNAIDRFERWYRMFQENPGGFQSALSLNSLADCYYTRGDPVRRDPQRAVRVGLESLRERARNVLLQSSASRALNTAAAAAGEAAAVSRWCLAAGQEENAVAALELGRGMVLHAATVDATVPSTLRAAGHDGLADRWEQEAGAAGSQPWDPGEWRELGGLADAPVPSDLRYRVLEAVEGSPVEKRLLSTPPVGEIASALRATDTHALVYLVSAASGEEGFALLITGTGQVLRLRCPSLTADGSPVDRFDRMQRERVGSAPSESLEQRWKRALGEVCDWAWTAVLNQVLDSVSAGRSRRPSRIVLIPVGKLGAVPWHAARRPVPGGRIRYAFEDAIIRYASSARQFVETSRRGRRPWHRDPALVRIAGSGLLWASEEIEDIHHRHYSHGIYLGRRRQAGRRVRSPRPADVRALLPSATAPGASLLHLGCHAQLAETPVGSALRLGSGTTLQVQDILRQARDRPADAPGGLVVLAACASDLTDREHDEVLTLATAFLAAGAVGVVGARWNVDDLPTALVMIMFHHYLNSGYDDPATALRAAQLWMVDPRRALPDGVGRRLTPELATIDPGEPGNWAAFTYQGQ